MTEVGAPLRPATRTVDTLAPGEVLVEVAGCGICHTDLGFLDDGVRTRKPLPLILGHEISGRVVAAAEGMSDLVGTAVIVPAVIPCGECDDCKAGRPMICQRQIMPGNDRDGGFASHVVVPGRGLCPVPGAPDDFDAPLPGASGLTLRHLAVIADAVSTPYQAVVRSGLQAGDVAIVVGLGGVGGYAALLARVFGAHVVGIDVDPVRRRQATDSGIDLVLDPSATDARALRKQIRAWARERGAPATRWKIFECSGAPAGQETAWGLLVHGATLMVVGFTMARIELRLSNLMAFDAAAIGNWGCAPELYPDIVDMVLDGRLDLVSRTELRPLSTVEQALDDVRQHRVSRRLVLTP
ncbi:MAG: 6-hydroxycyclohex-1-ene-1-carbonyl-CoA dehydrogenase [Deltaproteobacteria bacterium]|nr:MAG: 6-hydroxycyclohex-1-ene-1-carbonyl-CoA dehydrogenase [Deltaproteobacteria bacterium]